MRDAATAVGGGPEARLLAAAVTRSAARTRRLAALLAPWLRAGDCLCLAGDLGAGKTTFVAGLVDALGGCGPVVSPTFTLENRYPLAAARPAPPAPAAPVDAPGLVSHFDLYRTDGRPDPELLAMMLEAREAGALVCVEWGGPVERSLVPCLRIELALLADRRAGNGRRVELRSVGGPWAHGEQIATAWAGERGGRA